MSITEALGFIELMLAILGASAILDKILSFRGQCEECERRKKSEGITCEEKYKDEIERITFEFPYYPAVRNGKPVSCFSISCDDCDLNKMATGCKGFAGCKEAYEKWLKSKVDPYEEEK